MSQPNVSGPVESGRDMYAHIINTGTITDQRTINIILNRVDQLAGLLAQPGFKFSLDESEQLIAQAGQEQVNLPPGLLKGFELMSRLESVSSPDRQRAYAAWLVTRRPHRPPQLVAAREHYIPLAGYLSREDDLIQPHFSERRVVGEGPQRQLERERLPDVTEAIKRHPAFVLLGAPGSGKSTVLQRLTLATARAYLMGTGQRLPLFITLADYRWERELPLEFVRRRWSEQVTGDFVELARRGQMLLLADGLNEMLRLASSGDRRDRASAWERFFNDYFAEETPQSSRAIIASRDQADYDQPLGLPRVEIEPLDEAQIERFVRAYLPDDAANLLAAIDHLALGAQARIPYSLYVLTQLYDPASGDLPPNRGRLFAQYATGLLRGEKQAGHTWYRPEAALRALAELGYALQERGESTVLPAAEIRALLPATIHLPGRPRLVETPPEAVFYLACRAGLLSLVNPLEDSYKFCHQLLQEQFAAQYLLARWQAGEDVTALWRTGRTPAEMSDPQGGEWDPLPPPPATGWEQTTILAAGIIEPPDTFVRNVMTANPALAGRCLSEGNIQVANLTRTVVQQALLKDLSDKRLHRRTRIQAGRVLAEVGDPRFRPVLINNVEVIVPDLVEVPGGTATIGSQRWPFDRQAYSDERPQHKVEIASFYLARYPVTNAEYACFLRAGGYDTERYWTPTGWQWRQGQVDSSGPVVQILEVYRVLSNTPDLIDELFKEERITPDEADFYRFLIKMTEVEAEQWASGRYPVEPHDRPYYWDDPAYNAPNQPVVGVTWYEAMAYCAWLEEQLAGSGQSLAVSGGPVGGRGQPVDVAGLLAGGQWRVRLPTEAEWEWAAGGSKHTSYPWGRSFDPDKANTLEGRVLSPSPVGAYPGGAAACGALDMSGNVWEWTHTLFRDYPYQADDGREDPLAGGRRTLRGGAWGSDRRNARVSVRLDYRPVNFSFNSGFRLFVAPASP